MEVLAAVLVLGLLCLGAILACRVLGLDRQVPGAWSLDGFRYKPEPAHVVLKVSADDVRALRPSWDQAKCQAWMEANGPRLCDCLERQGRETLASLMDQGEAT